jgi:hypothetical protein
MSTYEPDASLPPRTRDALKRFHEATGLVPDNSAPASLVSDAKTLAKSQPTQLYDSHLEALAGVDAHEALLAFEDRENLLGRGGYAKEFGADTALTMAIFDVIGGVMMKEINRLGRRLRAMEEHARTPSVTSWPGSEGAEAVEVSINRDGSLNVPNPNLVDKNLDADALRKRVAAQLAARRKGNQ